MLSNLTANMSLISTTNESINDVSETQAQLTNGGNRTRSSKAGPSSGIHVPLRDVHAWTPERKLDVITVGAGFSGLTLAYKLQHQYGELQDMVRHRIYEAREAVGGTWLVNRYPGVQCDVPAHIYVGVKLLLLSDLTCSYLY